MLRNCLLALLAVLLAVPAVAFPAEQDGLTAGLAAASGPYCHGAPQADPGQVPEQEQAPDAAHGQQHECIGCIARFDGLPPASAHFVLPEPQPASWLTEPAPLLRAGPDTPPPKA